MLRQLRQCWVRLGRGFGYGETTKRLLKLKCDSQRVMNDLKPNAFVHLPPSPQHMVYFPTCNFHGRWPTVTYRHRP